MKKDSIHYFKSVATHTHTHTHASTAQDSTVCVGRTCTGSIQIRPYIVEETAKGRKCCTPLIYKTEKEKSNKLTEKETWLFLSAQQNLSDSLIITELHSQTNVSVL